MARPIRNLGAALSIGWKTWKPGFRLIDTAPHLSTRESVDLDIAFPKAEQRPGRSPVPTNLVVSMDEGGELPRVEKLTAFIDEMRQAMLRIEVHLGTCREAHPMPRPGE